MKERKKTKSNNETHVVQSNEPRRQPLSNHNSFQINFLMSLYFIVYLKNTSTGFVDQQQLQPTLYVPDVDFQFVVSLFLFDLFEKETGYTPILLSTSFILEYVTKIDKR